MANPDIEHVRMQELDLESIIDQRLTSVETDREFFARLGINDDEVKKRLRADFDRIFDDLLGTGANAEEA